MDSLTHFAIGACLGEAIVGKKIGRKAMLWGAVAHNLPDIDVVTVLWMDTTSGLLAHRGITHSLLFVAVGTPLLVALAQRWHRGRLVEPWRWWWLFGLALFLHLFLDTFNNYGVGWLEPFSGLRLAFNCVYVADPFFAFGAMLATAALFLFRMKFQRRRFWWQFGLCTAGLYLASAVWHKWQIDNTMRSFLAQQKISEARYFTTPAPLQHWLWFVVAGNDAGYHVGYRSVFDRSDSLQLTYFPRGDSLLLHTPYTADVARLKTFSQGFYTVEKWSDTLVFNDLRFGQQVGWLHPKAPFAFHYYVNLPTENKTVVQRGRFADWDAAATRAFWQRLWGG
jgi:inner membrane protein